MANPDRPPIDIHPITPDEWREGATGVLSLPPYFWKDQGSRLEETDVVILGAYSGEEMVGYRAVRPVPKEQLSGETDAALKELLVRRRLAGRLDTESRAALEDPATPPDGIVAHNLAFLSVKRQREGIGTALLAAGLSVAGQHATAERPMPAYMTVAEPNPAMAFFRQRGMEPLAVHGRPVHRLHPYYLPPSPEGKFAMPTKELHLMLGTVVTGPNVQL